VLLLLCGTIAVSVNFMPSAKSDIMYRLDVYSNPSAVPVANGTGSYTDGSYVELDAYNTYTVGNTKYIFDHWDVDNAYYTASDPFYLQMNADHNATAQYKTQYKLALTANPFTAQGVTDWIWSSATGWVQTNSMFIDENTMAWVGVEGLSSSPPGVYVHPDKWAYLVDFGGAASGYTDWGWIWTSGPAPVINMTAPKTAISNWGFYYTLYVKSDPSPTVPNPAGTGWYLAGTVVTLNAPDYSTNFAVYRYTLVTWKVDGASVAGNPINVTMTTNHTAIAYYKRQSFVRLDDNIGNFSGIKDTGKWYDDGVAYIFTAPEPLPVTSDIQYDFRYWDKPGYPWTNTTNPLSLMFDPSWDGETLRARYQTQYKLVIQSSPTLVGFLYPDSVTTGWYDAGSTVNYKAKPIVLIDANTRYVFLEWKNQYGGIDPNNNGTGPMSQPWILTAYYKLQYLATWSHTPTSITVTGSPGSLWLDNGTDVWYGLPATDVSGMFVFKQWVINSVAYPQGASNVHVGIMNGPIAGVANYANKTKIYMDPSVIQYNSPAYCSTFNVTVYATNFDANRLDGSGQPLDIYAFDFVIKFDPTLLELKSVTLNLASFFAPNEYFPGFNVIDNVAGTYHIVATVKGNYTGFSGTKAIFTMKFHVIYDTCYPLNENGPIYFTTLILSNHYGQSIWPELGYTNAYYYLNSVKPTLDITNHADGTHLVKVDWNVPQVYFDVDVSLKNGVKVHDFYIVLHYDKTMIEADAVTIANYLKAPYTAYTWWFDKFNGDVYVWVVQDSTVPLQNGSGLLFTVKFKVVNQLYYTTTGPFVLSSAITIKPIASYLSVTCKLGPFNQYVGTDAGFTQCDYLYNPLPGDLNFDGYVNVLDLQLIIDHWGMHPDYDVVVNSTTDLWDLVFVALRFGSSIH